MSQPQPDIDRVVREVLAQLGAAPAGEAPGSDGQLVLSCRVVTMSALDGRLAAVRRLVVPPQAVVTPAVRDELRRREIRLIHAAAAGPQACRTVRLCLVSVGPRFDPAPLAAALAGQGVELRSSASDCLLAATDQLAAEVIQPDRLGLLLTGHTAAAMCLANRRRGVRAVSGADAAAVAAAATAVGANLLVLDPAAASPFQLKQIVGEFCRGGVRPCPQVFRERLA